MSESAFSFDPADETGFDRVLAFSVPNRHARGRAVRLGPLLDLVLSAHDYPPPIMHLLAEGLVLTALMGSLMKDQDSQLTFQVQADGGIVDLLVCDYRQGELRGYVRHDPARIGALGSNPSLRTLFGDGYLAITFDLAASNERYQGVVALEGESLADVCQAYFSTSEQVPTLLRVGVRAEAGRCIAGGLLVQHFPDGEEGRERLHVQPDHPEWQHVSVMAGSTRHDELIDRELSLESLIWRLFHEEDEVRVSAGAQLVRGCRCSSDHYRTILARFSEADRAEMRGDDGLISIDCAFCSKIFQLDL